MEEALVNKNLDSFRSVSRDHWRIMEDVGGYLIQETGQDKRPARMVGHSSLESAAPAWMLVQVSEFYRSERRGMR